MIDALLGGAILVTVAVTLVAANYRARSRRRQELILRPPYPFTNWETLNPGAETESLRMAIKAIADGLSVDGQYLRPDDSFDKSLALKGQLIIDDDPAIDASEQVEEQCGVKWESNWNTVGEAISEIAKQLTSRRRNADVN